MASGDTDFGKNESEISFQAGLDRGDPFEAACEMSFLAQAFLAAIGHRLAGTGRANRTSAPAIAQVSRPSGIAAIEFVDNNVNCLISDIPFRTRRSRHDRPSITLLDRT